MGEQETDGCSEAEAGMRAEFRGGKAEDALS